MATLEQQIQAKLDELNALKEKQRKLDNQQKIIVGALVLKECENNKDFANKLLSIINNNASDRDKKKLESLISDLKEKTKPSQSAPSAPSAQQWGNQ